MQNIVYKVLGNQKTVNNSAWKRGQETFEIVFREKTCTHFCVAVGGGGTKVGKAFRSREQHKQRHRNVEVGSVWKVVPQAVPSHHSAFYPYTL